ncbi:MAG TPA: DUF1206 domain-containing protein [Baekduia sp.]|nr:DUF1206 domain-containing protein [Baekduia sp.]
MKASNAGRQVSAGAHRGGERVARSGPFEWLARAGFVARGVIYALIGVLAIKLALGVEGGDAADQQGALRNIASQRFGETLLIATAIGLAGYALWRLVRAAIGHGPEARDDGFDRGAALISGIAYATLCVIAIRVLDSPSKRSSGSGDAQRTTSDVLGWTGGPWLVGIAGLALIGVGLYQGYKGISQKFLEDAKTEQMSHRARQAFTGLGTFGHVARMVVFCMVGYFLAKAAIDYNPDEAIGLDGALSKLAQNSYGPYLLGVVAAGLFGFGLFSIVDARYHRI